MVKQNGTFHAKRCVLEHLCKRVGEILDHGRLDGLGCGVNWKKIARFERLEDICGVLQNSRAFLGRIGNAS